MSPLDDELYIGPPEDDGAPEVPGGTGMPPLPDPIPGPIPDSAREHYERWEAEKDSTAYGPSDFSERDESRHRWRRQHDYETLQILSQFARDGADDAYALQELRIALEHSREGLADFGL